MNSDMMIDENAIITLPEKMTLWVESVTEPEILCHGCICVHHHVFLIDNGGHLLTIKQNVQASQLCSFTSHGSFWWEILCKFAVFLVPYALTCHYIWD